MQTRDYLRLLREIDHFTETSEGDTVKTLPPVAPLDCGCFDIEVFGPMTKFDGDIEVSQVVEYPNPDGDGYDIERYDPEVPLEPGARVFWSAYLHLKAGGVECIGDFYTRETAQAYADHIVKTFDLIPPVMPFTADEWDIIKAGVAKLKPEHQEYRF